MSEEYVEVVLSDGTIVRCAPVPPLAIPEVVAAQPECQMPPAPMVEVQTKVGTEEKPAQRGSAEYDAWRMAIDEVRRRRGEIERIAYFVLGVIAWKLPGDSKFSSKVPKDWAIPDRLVRVGIKIVDSELGRIGDFIRYGLIRTGEDLGKINRIVFGTQMLTESEVNASAALFPGDEEGPADIGDTTEG